MKQPSQQRKQPSPFWMALILPASIFAMRKILLATALLSLAGCTLDPHHPDADSDWYFRHTAPGAAVPNSYLLLRCYANDAVGRCEDWNKKSDTCINPKGMDANPPVVPCASINKDDGHE